MIEVGARVEEAEVKMKARGGRLSTSWGKKEAARDRVDIGGVDFEAEVWDRRGHFLRLRLSRWR